MQELHSSFAGMVETQEEKKNTQTTYLGVAINPWTPKLMIFYVLPKYNRV